MADTFRGGIHPEYRKDATSGLSIEILPPPARLYFPVLQHIGAPCEPVCKVGDRVAVGQCIADSDAPVSSRIHSSVSGRVVSIEPHLHPNGQRVLTIVVENDFEDDPLPDARQTIELMHAAGIVGMGGAGFPAHVKLSSAAGKVDTLLINGAECEPYLTSDHRLMLEHPELIIGGAQILRRCLGLSRATICVEDNKKDAIAALHNLVVSDHSIQIAVLKTKYPQGGEKQIIKAVTGREVPSGKLPVDAGCVVFNVDSVASLCRAWRFGQPVVSRIVTVAGPAIAKPSMFSVRIGTPFSHVIEQAGGFRKDPVKVIMGGPMMGIPQYSLDAPVIKTTSGILGITRRETREADHPSCIHCGRCVRACPMHLMPNYLALYAAADRLDECERLGIMDCIECGSCSYVCPGRMHLVAQFKVKKNLIAERRRAGR